MYTVKPLKSVNTKIQTPPDKSKPRSPGYWKHQFSTKKGNKISPLTLVIYTGQIKNLSEVLDSDLTGTPTDFSTNGPNILDPDNSSVMLAKAKRQLFALWLNIVSQKVSQFEDLMFINPSGQLVNSSQPIQGYS